MSRRHLINSSDVFVIKGFTVCNWKNRIYITIISEECDHLFGIPSHLAVYSLFVLWVLQRTGIFSNTQNFDPIIFFFNNYVCDKLRNLSLSLSLIRIPHLKCSYLNLPTRLQFQTLELWILRSIFLFFSRLVYSFIRVL